MSTKHTPGPWAVHRGSWSDDGFAQYELHGIKTVNAADGSLIAAAPDLLEALKYARRMVKASECDIAFIDAAIAKATGATE